jgi:hypothetical protein
MWQLILSGGINHCCHDFVDGAKDGSDLVGVDALM